jgi:hypothetical protein
MPQNSKSTRFYFSAFFAIATTLFSSPGFCGKEPVANLAQLIKTITYSQPDNPFIPPNSETMSSEEIYLHIQGKMGHQGIHALKGKNLRTPLSNLDFLNIVYAFSGGSQSKDLISKKLYLKEKGFISSTDIGLATELKGEITQFHDNSSFGRSVSLATPLFQFDRIKTGRKSRAAFTLNDKSRVILSSASNISIDKNIYDPEERFRKMLFRVSKGIAHFVVTKAMKKGSTFTVITPNGVAAVRGTEFVTLVEPDGNTRFVVLEGKIETAPRLPGGKLGKHVFIGAGEMQTLYKNGRTSRIKKVPHRLLDKLQKNSLIKNKIKKPEVLREANEQLNKSKSYNKRMAEAEISRDEKTRKPEAVDSFLANAKNTMSQQTLDRETLRAFNDMSHPSTLDRIRSRHPSQPTPKALQNLLHKLPAHP